MFRDTKEEEAFEINNTLKNRYFATGASRLNTFGYVDRCIANNYVSFIDLNPILLQWKMSGRNNSFQGIRCRIASFVFQFKPDVSV